MADDLDLPVQSEMSWIPPAPALIDEPLRQEAVERSGIRERKGDPQLRAIVEAAAREYEVRIAVISIIDGKRQWFAAQRGLQVDETPRAHAFCLHAIQRPGEPLVILDARTDERFSANPLVTSNPFLRFYAGVPLLERDGYPVGALCIIDPQRRSRPPSVFQLIRLAREVERIAGW